MVAGPRQPLSLNSEEVRVVAGSATGALDRPELRQRSGDV